MLWQVGNGNALYIYIYIYYIRKQQYLSSFELNNENDDEKVEEKNDSQEYLHKEIVRC